MSKPKNSKPKFERADGAEQPILRLTKAEAESPDWDKLFKKRLGRDPEPDERWQIRKPYHRMGNTNEIHKGNASDCPYCHKRGVKDEAKTAETKEKKK